MSRVLLALFLPFTFLAGQGSPPAAREHGPETGPRREQILARLHRRRMERLQLSLGISAEMARAIADRWARFDVDSRDNRRRMKLLHRQVNGILLSSLSEEDKNTGIRPLVQQYSMLRSRQQELRETFEAEIRKALTPAQQGRFLVVVEEIRRSIAAVKEQRAGVQAPE